MEPITSLLDAFIKLADRIINLEKTKLQDKQTLFNEIVKPLFDELEPVATNYVQIFQKTRKMVMESSQGELAETIAVLAEERESMVLARVKVRQMARSIYEHIKDDDVNKFASLVNEFFFISTELSTTPSISGKLLVYMEAIVKEKKALSEPEKARMVVVISEIINYLEMSWGKIAKSYEILRIRMVASPKFIRKDQPK